ncbi:MAG: dephospho-CoA kinase [Crocinitomicaceae bacterium]
MQKRIGITGGIGAGKSTVSKIFEAMGFPVFNSDLQAKNTVDFHPEVKVEIISLFGDSIYTNNELNRPKMAELIFNNPLLREKLNHIIHPRVRAAFDEFALISSSEFVFNEAAILFETGAYKQLDATILVTSSKELRIQRLLSRDKTSREAIEARMNAQWSDEEKRELADYLIENDENQSLIKQVEQLISELLN